MNKTLGIVLGVLIILGIFWLLSSDDGSVLSLNDGERNSASVFNGTSGQNNNTTAPEEMSSVVLRDTTEGTTVVVQSAKLAQPGYIVIYRTNRNGVADEIGHTGLLQKGEYGGLTIALDTSVAAEETIIAALHKDDGDGVYEVPGADGYLGSGSNRVTTDVDVVEVPFANEPTSLESQVEAYLDYRGVTTSPTSTQP